jgi:serine/threonine protein kinase
MARLSAKRLVLHRNHLSPEFKLESKRTVQGDVFSLGCMFYKLVYGVYPFSGANDTELNTNIKYGTFRTTSVIDPELPLQIAISKPMHQLMTDMLQY